MPVLSFLVIVHSNVAQPSGVADEQVNQLMLKSIVKFTAFFPPFASSHIIAVTFFPLLIANLPFITFKLVEGWNINLGIVLYSWIIFYAFWLHFWRISFLWNSACILGGIFKTIGLVTICQLGCLHCTMLTPSHAIFGPSYLSIVKTDDFHETKLSRRTQYLTPFDSWMSSLILKHCN